MNIKLVSFDGEYPNLCSGELVILADGMNWVFPPHALSSGGYVTFDENWSEDVEQGPWEIREWPDGFPEKFKDKVLCVINSEIPWGCCGGCV